MFNKIMRKFFTIILNDKTKAVFAFIFYMLFIIWLIDVKLPSVLDVICFVVAMIIILIGCSVYFAELLDKFLERNHGKVKKNFIKKVKKIVKEILMYVLVSTIYNFILGLFIDGKPGNQEGIEQNLPDGLVFSLILIVFIGPILEEFIFRFLPSKFIKNKMLYIIISSLVFAGLHVFDDPNAFYYIWCYLPDALYWCYRYYKTKDILVPISLHMCNNFIATLALLSYFQ